jgi:hypothetical protein
VRLKKEIISLWYKIVKSKYGESFGILGTGGIGLVV